jgi:hypothetical protein
MATLIGTNIDSSVQAGSVAVPYQLLRWKLLALRQRKSHRFESAFRTKSQPSLATALGNFRVILQFTGQNFEILRLHRDHHAKCRCRGNLTIEAMTDFDFIRINVGFVCDGFAMAGSVNLHEFSSSYHRCLLPYRVKPRQSFGTDGAT